MDEACSLLVKLPTNIAFPKTTQEKAMAKIYGRKLPETPTKNISFYFVALEHHKGKKVGEVYMLYNRFKFLCFKFLRWLISCTNSIS